MYQYFNIIFSTIYKQPLFRIINYTQYYYTIYNVLLFTIHARLLIDLFYPHFLQPLIFRKSIRQRTVHCAPVLTVSSVSSAELTTLLASVFLYCPPVWSLQRSSSFHCACSCAALWLNYRHRKDDCQNI